MQVPLPFFAVDPAERATRQPGDEIVAPGVVAIPPAGLDAFRAGERHELALLQPLGLEKPYGPWPRRTELARIPLARLDAPPGVLGTMVGLRGEPMHRVVAQARTQ